MKRVDYWLLDDMVSRIEFSLDGKKMIFFWRCGEQTEMDSGTTRMKADLAWKELLDTRVKLAKEKSSQKSVRKIIVK